MKRFLTFLAVFLSLVFPAISQTQGTALRAINGTGTNTVIHNTAHTKVFTNSAQGFGINIAPKANFDLSVLDGIYAEPNLAGASFDGQGGGLFGGSLEILTGGTFGIADKWRVGGESLGNVVFDTSTSASITNIASGIFNPTNINIGFTAGNPPTLTIQNRTNGPANLLVNGSIRASSFSATNVWDISNLRYWGAQGGGADDSVPFQRLLANGGNNVFVPSGNWLVTTSLVLLANQTLTIDQGILNLGTNNRIILKTGSRIIGSGPSNTMIIPYITNGAAIAATQAVANIELNGFTLFGNDLGATGITMNAWTSPRIDNVKIDRFRNATDTGVGIYMIASSLGGCYDGVFVQLTVNNCDTPIFADSTDNTYICGYHKFFGLKMDQEKNGLFLLKSTVNGSGYFQFYDTFLQGTATSADAVAIRIEGVNNRFYGLEYDGVTSTNIWIRGTAAGGNFFSGARGIDTSKFYDENTAGPATTFDNGARVSFSPRKSFTWTGEGATIDFDPTSGMQIAWYNNLVNNAWRWIMPSNSTPNLTLLAAGGGSAVWNQNGTLTLSSNLSASGMVGIGTSLGVGLTAPTGGLEVSNAVNSTGFTAIFRGTNSNRTLFGPGGGLSIGASSDTDYAGAGNLKVRGNQTNTGYIVLTNTSSASPSGMTGVQIYGGSNGVNANVINVLSNGVSNFNVSQAGNTTNAGNIQTATLNTTLAATIAGNFNAGANSFFVNSSTANSGLWGSGTLGWPVRGTGAQGTIIDYFSHPVNGIISVNTNFTSSAVITGTNGIVTFYRNTPTSITVAGSPVNWTNTTAVNVAVYVDGVSVTGIVGINGTTIFNTIGQNTVSDVEPGDWVTITYTIGTPTAWYR